MIVYQEQGYTSPHGLPEHIVLGTDGVYRTDPLCNEWWSAGDRIIEVPDQEITFVDGKYVHACPIPTGYLEQLIQVGTLQHRRQHSHTRFVAQERMTDEGYTSSKEFAVAQMAEHLGETAHISALVSDTAEIDDHLVRYGHIEPANHLPDSKYVRPTPKRPRIFEMSRLTESAGELVDTDAYDRDLAAGMRAMIGMSDWDPAMAYGQLKQWDQLALMYETLRKSTIEYAGTISKEIERVYRESDARGDEIPRAQIERLNEQLQGLRMQVFDYSRRFKVACHERERAVNSSGINFPRYLSLEERKLTAQAKRRGRYLATREVDRLNAMTPEQRIDALKAVQKSGVAQYRPRRDGVDAAGSQDPVRLDPDAVD